MATKPVHEFTRAKLPNVNQYCGLNILTETVPEPTSPFTSKSTWTPKSTTEFPSTTTLFNRMTPPKPRPKPILEISNENVSEDLIENMTQIVLPVTPAKGESSIDEGHLFGKPILLGTMVSPIIPEEPLPEEPVKEPLPEQCCGSTEEEQLDQSSSHFKITNDLWTFVMYLIPIILYLI